MGEGELGDQCPGGGFAYGPSAEDVEFSGVVTTDWVAGETAQVSC